MASEFLGTWELESSKNFDEFVKAHGLKPEHFRSGATKPKMTITRNKDDIWEIKTVLPATTVHLVFKLNEPFVDIFTDGRETQCLITIEGKTLIQVQKESPDSIITRTVDGNYIYATCKFGDVVSERVFKRISK